MDDRYTKDDWLREQELAGGGDAAEGASGDDAAADRLAPWERPGYGADAGPPLRNRHDAFTTVRRARFLRHLVKYGNLSDAARRSGVSIRTIYRHQERDPEFARHCRAALEMAGGALELIAWQRAVAGVDEQFACGGKVYTRKRYSDGLMRLLLQGALPKKYGAGAGFVRRRLTQKEREAIRREEREKLGPKLTPAERERKIADFMRRFRRTAPDTPPAAATDEEEDPPSDV